MSTAIIVKKNANRIIFKVVHGPDYQSFKVCSDLSKDGSVRSDIRPLLHHGIKAYLGVSIMTEAGKYATLIISSMEARKFSSQDIHLACELCACIEDRYRMRRETDIANTVDNLSISSVLLSSIKVNYINIMQFIYI
jgi:hypothetical protein